MNHRRPRKASAPGRGRFRVVLRANEQTQETSAKPQDVLAGRDTHEAQDGAAEGSEASTSQALAVLPQKLDSAAVHRNQLAAEFLESYYTDSMPHPALVRGKLQQWFEPQQGAIALAAADSLLLQYAAKVCSDESLRREAMMRHQSALQLLRAALQRPNPTRDDRIFGVVDILGIYDKEYITGQEHSDETPNGAHAQGMYALILRRGPKVFDSGIARDVALNSMHLPLMSALIARKACVFGQPEWQAHLYTPGGRPSKMSELVGLGFLLPGLLQKTDEVVADPKTTYVDYTLLLAELVGLEGRLLDWLVERYANHFDGTPYRIRRVTRGESIKELTGLDVDYPFDVVLEHASFLDALAHFNYWSLLLMVRLTILQVGSLATEDVLNAATGTPPTKQRQRWMLSCAEIADSFCQSVPYTFSLQGAPREIAIQTVCSFLMPLVRPWYEQAGELTKAAWCSRLIVFAQSQELRPDLSFEDRVRKDYLTKAYFGWINLAF